MTKRLILLAVLLLSIAGCATVEKPTEPSVPPSNQAEAALARGDFETAARLYLEQAQQATPPTRQALQLSAVDALIRGEKFNQAAQLLNDVRPSLVQDTTLRERGRLLEARLALLARQPELVLRVLADAQPPQLADVWRAEYHELRAEALGLLGNRLEAARELVWREQYLRDREAILANQQTLWQTLAVLPPRALQQLRAAPPPDVLSGWLELVQLTKAYPLQPEEMRARLARWRAAYPRHPVLPEMLAALEQRVADAGREPQRIALLLPLSGPFAPAAEAIRDGFLAAYYARGPRPDQEVRIYDAGAVPTDIHIPYYRAVQEGNQFVVGPLDKEAVNLLSLQQRLPVPTLALNYGDNREQWSELLYQFSLSPEDEARQVAERAWLDGHVNAAVLAPEGPWGERMYNAFRQRWDELGGTIIAQQRYSAEASDFAQPLRRLLSLDASLARHRNVQSLLGSNLKFTPRRRADMDFIFLAAYPQAARLIRPQLRFHHGGDVPVYATSHVFSGTINPETDRDMDGILFCDMPWMLAEGGSHRGLRDQVERHMSPAGQRLQRLYALGVDAYNVLGALPTLRDYPYERYDGETGSLSMDGGTHLRRQLTWLRFRGGRPVPVESAY